MGDNRASRRTLDIRERLAAAEERANELQKDNDALRDAANAILEQAGGSVTVSMDHVLRATRKRISVLPMGSYIIITTDPDRALAPSPGVRERLLRKVLT